MRPLRLVFMGTPHFAVPVLAAILESGHEVACVYCQPPRPAGRGRAERPAPVHALALGRGLPVRTPKSLKRPSEQGAFAALHTDAAVIAAYGLILPLPVLSAPRLGCLNVHPSLLPRWRGAAPIQRALLAGDTETGVSIMVMDEGLDTGPVVLARTVPIGEDTTAGELHDQLSELGGRLVVEALAGLDEGRLAPTPQPAEGITHAAKLSPEEERLDWRSSATQLARKLRAFTPWPRTWFEHEGERIRVLEADPAPKDMVIHQPPAPTVLPGTVLDDHLTVACGDGMLRLRKVQRAGRKAMGVEEFLRGYPIPAGTVLEVGA
jgi:methionyl-tRNA formyltransferase